VIASEILSSEQGVNRGFFEKWNCIYDFGF